MATVATTNSAGSVANAIKKQKRKRAGSPFAPNELHLLSGTVTLSAATLQASFTTANDEIELLTFPPETYLVGWALDLPVLDEHATPALVLDVELDDGTTTYILHDGSTRSTTVGRTAGTLESLSLAKYLDADSAALEDAALFLDVSGFTLQLANTTPPATDSTVSRSIGFKVLVYKGDVADLGTISV